MYACMNACTDSAAPAHARTRAHRPAAPRQSSSVSQTPHPMYIYLYIYIYRKGAAAAPVE